MKKILFRFISPLSWLISFLVPKDPRKIAFGAWSGRMFADNPRYLYLYLQDNTQCQVRWIGRRSLFKTVFDRSDMPFLERNSLRATWFLMRSKTWFGCQGASDFSDFSVHGGDVTFVNLWHGIPLKYMGAMSPGSRNERACCSWFRWPLHFVAHVFRMLTPSVKEYVASSSPDMTSIMEKCFPCRFSRERTLPFGSPRMDYLIHNRENKALKDLLRDKYSKMLGFGKDCKIVLYAPTWRFSGSNVFTFGGLGPNSAARLKEVLRDCNAVMVEKLHPNTYQFACDKSNGESGTAGCIVPIKPTLLSVFDIQEFLLIADVLITDYSSLYFDFSTLRRPCCHYVYDIDDYAKQDSGLAYDLKDVAGGPLIKDIAALTAYIGEMLRSPRFEPASGLVKLMEYETGNACRQFCGRFLGGV